VHVRKQFSWTLQDVWVAGRLGLGYRTTVGTRQVGKEAQAGKPAKYQSNPDIILLARCLRLCKALRYRFVGWDMGLVLK
jgi:hypothetical protein